MARAKKTEEEILYRVTSTGADAVFLNGKSVVFNEKKQAIVDKETFERLKEMGVLL